MAATIVVNPRFSAQDTDGEPLAGACLYSYDCGTTTITDFDDGFPGKEITILALHSVTITDGTNIFLSGSANYVMALGDTLSLIQRSTGAWYETGRGDN